MVFLDNSNFFKSVSKLEGDRVIDYHKLNKFVLSYLSKNPQYSKRNLFHVRTYYYDGEYTENLLSRIKNHLKKTPKSPENEEDRHEIESRFDKALRRLKAQKREMERCKNFYFFETRLKPLQYSYQQGVFQKGVDVQLAVDLVSGAYLDNYDIAVLFSGDIDLYESVKLVKTLGKQVIIFSHEKLMSDKMIGLCDFYKDIERLEDRQLDEFTHIFERKPNKNSIKK